MTSILADARLAVRDRAEVERTEHGGDRVGDHAGMHDPLRVGRVGHEVLQQEEGRAASQDEADLVDEARAAGLVVETGSAREVHQFALLGAYGAEAVHPYLALDTVLAEMEKDPVRRDIEKYYLTLFGTPSPGGTWGNPTAVYSPRFVRWNLTVDF